MELASFHIAELTYVLNSLSFQVISKMDASGVKAGNSFSLEHNRDQKKSKEPTGIFQYPTSVTSVGFRNLSQNSSDDGSYRGHSTPRGDVH